MFITESMRQIHSSVSLIHNDSLWGISTKIDIYEEQGGLFRCLAVAYFFFLLSWVVSRLNIYSYDALIINNLTFFAWWFHHVVVEHLWLAFIYFHFRLFFISLLNNSCSIVRWSSICSSWCPWSLATSSHLGLIQLLLIILSPWHFPSLMI